MTEVSARRLQPGFNGRVLAEQRPIPDITPWHDKALVPGIVLFAPLITACRELSTVEQAAGYLQLSQSSIRSYIRQGTLKAFRVAGLGKVLIPRQELLKLLETT